MKAFGRLLTAMVTPFTADQSLDLPRARALALEILASGSDGVVVAGTTGESPTLSGEEKLALLSAVVESVGDRGTVIAGTGSNDTRASIRLSQEAEARGAHGLLLINPYYNKPNQEGLYLHFKAIAEATSLPVMLYNHPPRTGVCLAPETLARLAEISNVVALKDSSADLDLVSAYRAATPASFLIYSGNDSLTLPVMALGGYGLVSVASHLVGRELRELIDAALEGRYDRAREIHYRILELMEGLFMAPSPAPTKAALAMQGRPVGGTRLPIPSLTDAEALRLGRILSELSLIRTPVEA